MNPSGSFALGGPSADCGVTGRKIIVDSYGGAGRHGGGAFSGKDPSKVDRSGAYYCRYVARRIVQAGLAERAEVQVSYAIGRAKPMSVKVDTFGTGDAAAAERFVSEHLRFPPGEHHQGAGSPPAALPPDHELRPLRQGGTALGEAGSSTGVVFGGAEAPPPLSIDVGRTFRSALHQMCLTSRIRDLPIRDPRDPRDP